MSSHEVLQEHSVATHAPGPLRPGRRLIGIDVARGLALIGLLAVHIFPDENEVTGEPTLAWSLFSGHSAALFALLAGVGLALSSGESTPHQGRGMTADRWGVAVRAVMVGAVGLIIAAILPWDPPANSILVYYAVFFLVAIPFLHLRARTLFLSAAVFALVFPLLLLWLGPELPESSAWNHTVINLLTEPLGTASELLLTGSYPALAYMAYVLVGLGVGRLDLRSTRVQAIIAGTGVALAVLASLVSFLLLHAAGGYEALRAASDLTRSELDWALTFGFEDVSEVSAWWLAVITAHSNTTLAIASSLGLGLAVTGMLLLITPRTGRLLAPLAAMGAMTLTLYSAHLLALTPGAHENNPALWFTLHLVVAALFAWFWRQGFGQGPLERVVATAARKARQTITG
jgi:uncharacterized membrane protein YeiB